MAEDLIFREEGGIARLTLNRPQSLNALTQKMLEDFIAALDSVAASDSARVLLIDAAGRAFCSGADLQGASQMPTPRDMGAGLERYYNPIVLRLRELHVPVITAVQGAAAGGGCALALLGDIVIAARSAYFLQPFAGIGLVPDVGATWLLPRLAGRARATAMMMLGDRITAETALHWGLIWQMVEDEALAATAEALAQRLAQGPTQSYALMRRAIWDALESDLPTALARERVDQRTAGLTEDHAEGVAAFLQKRKAQYRGR